MADNVDISLKLGTEADLSSAISAGARAGAAFAAAAQNAVNGIQLNAGATMRAFQTSSSKVSTSADIAREIRAATITSGLITQMAVKAAVGGSGGMLPPPSKPFASAYLPMPGQGGNIGFHRSDPRFWGGKTSDPIYIGQGDQYANDNVSKALALLKATEQIRKIMIGRFGPDGRGGGRGGGGGYTDAEWYETPGGKFGSLKNAFFKALGAGKVAQMLLTPYFEYEVAEAAAGYKAETARSVGGFRQEQLDKLIAKNKEKSTYSLWGGLGLGAVLGAVGGVIAAPFTGGASLAAIPALMKLGAIGGGIAGLKESSNYQKDSAKKEQELLQQYKSLSEAQKRYYNNILFGGNYNTSYAKAMADLGLGVTEETDMNNAVNALTFRGDLARGKISAGQMQALAFMPNTLAAMINGETDPAARMAAYRADLEALGDESLTASVARDTVGLGTWVTAQSGAYAQMANRWNADTLGAVEARANSVVGGYINRHAQNVVTTQIADMAMFLKNAHDAPESFWGGQAKPTEKENDWAAAIFNYARTTAMQNPLGTATPIIVNFVVDGETLKSVNVGDAIKERNSFLTGGQSFIAGGY